MTVHALVCIMHGARLGQLCLILGCGSNHSFNTSLRDSGCKYACAALGPRACCYVLAWGQLKQHWGHFSEFAVRQVESEHDFQMLLHLFKDVAVTEHSCM